MGSSLLPADGCLSVPLDEREVLAAVKSVLQPQHGGADDASRAAEFLSFDGFTLDVTGRVLLDHGGNEAMCTPRCPKYSAARAA